MITDEMLAKAAAELAEAINASLPAPEECHHQFSAKFEKKIKRLNYRTNHPVQHRILRSTASILLVILLGFSSVLSVSVEAREAVFGWIRDQYESFYAYFFEGKPEDMEPASYHPGWMPEGYEYETSFEIDGGKMYIFTNPSGAIAQFSYSSNSVEASIFIETANYEHRTVQIGGQIGDLYVAPDDQTRNELIWQSQDGSTLFSISAKASEDDLVKVAENIVKE